MKTPIALLGLLSFATLSFAQGLVNFANNSSTLISLDGVAMPGANGRQFIFAVFLAPSTTVVAPGQTIPFNDSRFQLVGAYNTNHPTAAGRMVTRNGVDVTSAGGNPNNFAPGSTVDFVVRCWSVDAGATWQEALANYNSFGVGAFGSSTVGNDLALGGDGVFPSTQLLGLGSMSVGGFNVVNTAGPVLPWLYVQSPLTNQTVIRGSTVTFAFGASASPTPEYGWYKNGVLMSGATNRHTLVITNAQPSDAGLYGITWRNYWWIDGMWHSVTSSASLTVLVPPTITSQPSSQTVETGATVRLTVDATGDQPLVYRWMFNGNSVLGGATSAVLELSNVGAPQSGSYTVVITNVGGAVTSAPAMLSVISPIERRMVPGITLNAQPASFLSVEYASALGVAPDWAAFPAVYFTNSQQYFFDLTSPIPSQRFYRASQISPVSVLPSLSLQMIPALTLTGSVGNQIRVDGINHVGPTDAWFTLDTVMLTNTSQLYFDVTAPGQPARLYRLVPVP